MPPMLPQGYVVRQVQHLIPAWEWGREVDPGVVEWSGVRSPTLARSIRLAGEDDYARRRDQRASA